MSSPFKSRNWLPIRLRIGGRRCARAVDKILIKHRDQPHTHRQVIYSSFLSVVLIASLLTFTACNRRSYRLWADRDAYHLIQSRQNNPDWVLPERTVEPESISRLADEHDPDCGPRPPDDPAANQWLRNPYRFHNSAYWDRIGQTPTVENSIWQHELPINEEGVVELDKMQTIEMALLHSREYQTQVEQLHLAALGLSSNRFEFDTQWTGGLGTSYRGTGRNSLASRSIEQSSNLGLSRSLASGGQFAASVANSLVWQLTPSGPTTASSSLAFSLVQPLLRGAYRHIRLENLSQAERGLLYQVRDFARFRRQFYRNITSTYLGLLAQTQALRNQRANLRSLELNYQEFQELFARKMVSQIQIDQVFQDYQSGRISILAAEQGYANSLDNFKFLLGLPPRVEIKIDESFLKPFELSDPKFDELRERTDKIYLALIQYLPPEVPPGELLTSTFESYAEIQAELETIIPSVEEELERWQKKLAETDTDRLTPEDLIDYEQQKTRVVTIASQLTEIKDDIKKDLGDLETRKEELDKLDAGQAWESLSRLIGRRHREQAAALFIIQNQIRLFLIEVIPFDIEQESAIDLALSNRLDLMNQRGQTMDAWRGVEVAADSLRSDLSVSANVGVGTDPGKQNPIRFDSSASSVALGLQFDGPLNRFNERNGYRTAQISYQQARRSYMASEDDVINTIRADLRGLRISWLNFQISRQQLIAATRQVDEAQFQLRAQTSSDSSATRDLLQALQGLLSAKNNLISSWIDYEVGRMDMFVDLELLYIEPDGTWSNSTFNPGQGDPLLDDEAMPEPQPADQSNASEPSDKIDNPRRPDNDDSDAGPGDDNSDSNDLPRLDADDARLLEQSTEDYFRR